MKKIFNILNQHGKPIKTTLGGSAGKMTQWLRVLTILPEDPGLVLVPK